ncbi:VWA domain-containing protein [Caballeronia sordidicola]|nr:VWA domain-containing protein [Caballeronia sordidicola]
MLNRSSKQHHDDPLAQPVGPNVGRAAALLRGDEGAVAVIFAICGSMMIASLCIALDTIDGGMTQSRMQSALDVATLSAGVDLKHGAGLSVAQWQKDARAYYNANMPIGYMSLTMPDSGFSATLSGSPATGETIQLSAAGTLKLIAPVVVPGTSGSGSGSGGQTLPTTTPMAANNTALYLPQSTLELAMVLDNTGSMADPASSDSSQGSKIEGLRTAANALVSQIFAQSGNNSYIGLVPFTTMVNVGTSLLPTGSWITPAANDPNSYNSTGISMMVQPSVTGSGWGGCPVEPRVGSARNLYPLAYAPASSPGFTPFYYNVPKAGFKITNYSAVAKDTSCPVANVNTVMNVPLTYQIYGSPSCGTSMPATIYNSWFQPPATGNNAPAMTTWDQNGNSYYSNERPCHIQPMLFLTQNQTTLAAAINQMTANGSTIIPTGLLWGWRMVSSAWSPQVSSSNGWVSSDPNLPRPEATTQGLQRVVIVLTDGENDPGGASGIMPSPSFNGLSGVGNSALTAPTVGLPNGSTTSVADINTFQLAVCTAMKNDGITIYSITFGTYGTDTTSVQAQQTMQNCASPGNYYHAPTNAALTAIFQQIAGNLGVLRLTQ